MATIDKLGIGIHEHYVRQKSLQEQFETQYHVREAAGIHGQIRVISVSPQSSATDLLLGARSVGSRWATFPELEGYYTRNYSPFVFSTVAPGLRLATEEGIEQRFRTIVCTTPQEQAEKEILHDVAKCIGELREMQEFIVGQLGQFLQG